VCPELPITATSKVLVRTLRAQRWNCPDEVWWRPDARDGTYRRLENADVGELERSTGTGDRG
jgi:fatty-acyl-CoA synthase